MRVVQAMQGPANDAHSLSQAGCLLELLVGLLQPALKVKPMQLGVIVVLADIICDCTQHVLRPLSVEAIKSLCSQPSTEAEGHNHGRQEQSALQNQSPQKSPSREANGCGFYQSCRHL